MQKSVYLLTQLSNALVTAPHTSRRYFSRYFGKSVANEDSVANVPPALSAGLKGSTCHYEIGVMNSISIEITVHTLQVHI